MRDALDHQNAAGLAGSPVGIFSFRTGELLHVVDKTDDDMDPRVRSRLRAETSQTFSVPEDDLEFLLVCHNHPQSSAVDCLTCVPEED